MNGIRTYFFFVCGVSMHIKRPSKIIECVNLFLGFLMVVILIFLVGLREFFAAVLKEGVIFATRFFILKESDFEGFK